MPSHMQDEVQMRSLKDAEAFWAYQAEQLYWHKKPSRTLKQTTKKLPGNISHPHWTWFPDGEISTSYNCIDRHVKNGHGDSTAIIWDSPVTNSKEKYTYSQLLTEVQTLAGVLREEGVQKGDVVLIYSKETLRHRLPYSRGVREPESRVICRFPYLQNGWECLHESSCSVSTACHALSRCRICLMLHGLVSLLTSSVPMIPAAVFAMLAVARLGAIHAVVFGGFAPASLAQRIEASKPRAIMTASCGIEGAKGPLDYKPFINGAIQKSSIKPEKVIVWQRDQCIWEPIDESKGERHWQRLIQNAKERGLTADNVPVKSNEGLYIIYTSGKVAPPECLILTTSAL